jgi:Fur family transcriptional regulator, ferric uptake regulator
MSIKRFKEKFIESGLNFTNQRRAIAEILLNDTDHPNIDEIYLKVQQVDKSSSIATIYRNISLFIELGLIEKRDFKENKSRYEFKSKHEHNHIIVNDGEILEFTNSTIDDIIHNIVNEKGLELQNYTITVYCKRQNS